MLYHITGLYHQDGSIWLLTGYPVDKADPDNDVPPDPDLLSLIAAEPRMAATILNALSAGERPVAEVEDWQVVRGGAGARPAGTESRANEAGHTGRPVAPQDGS